MSWIHPVFILGNVKLVYQLILEKEAGFLVYCVLYIPLTRKIRVIFCPRLSYPQHPCSLERLPWEDGSKDTKGTVAFPYINGDIHDDSMWITQLSFYLGLIPHYRISGCCNFRTLRLKPEYTFLLQ